MMPSKLVSLVLELRGLLPESGCMCACILAHAIARKGYMTVRLPQQT